MVKPTEKKPEARPTSDNQVNGAQKAEKRQKKLPPAKSYTVKRGFG